MTDKEKLISFLKNLDRNYDGVLFVPYPDMREFMKLIERFTRIGNRLNGIAKEYDFAFNCDQLLEFYNIKYGEI